MVPCLILDLQTEPRGSSRNPTLFLTIDQKIEIIIRGDGMMPAVIVVGSRLGNIRLGLLESHIFSCVSGTSTIYVRSMISPGIGVSVRVWGLIV